MKLTEIERTIIVINMIGVILEEYGEDETTDAIKVLKEKCLRFTQKQSGVEDRIVTETKRRRIVGGGLRSVIVDAKRHKRFVEASILGDKIWRETVDHFAKQKLTINAVTLIESVYLFHEKIITKHTTIKRADIDAYRFYEVIAEDVTSMDGTAIGGHLMGLLARECGESINGKLRAIKLKTEDKIGRAA